MTTDEARFVELYECHYPAVYRYCRRRTSAERADDVVADTFLTAWSKINDVPEDPGAIPWLYSVAYRIIGHQWRSAGRRRRLASKLDGLGLDANHQPDEQIVIDEESRLVLDALATLKPHDQEILRLTVWEELPHREIAVVLGVTVDAVKKRASRARRALAASFESLERSKSPAARKGGAW